MARAISKDWMQDEKPGKRGEWVREDRGCLCGKKKGVLKFLPKEGL
jgi:hypothetical protein